jgi:hypothetical protein
MDGMGEAYRTMLRAERTNDRSYVSDFSFGEDSFQCIPSDLKEQAQISYFDWREAESVYVYERKETTMHLIPVYKRFTPENSPPRLVLSNMLFPCRQTKMIQSNLILFCKSNWNHGFENMDSVGALYSRVSSHIFGDWNACGKAMG